MQTDHAEDVRIRVPKDRGIYRCGDRVPWCQGCSGVVTAKIAGLLIIKTDDGVDRMASEETIMRTESSLKQRGVRWQ